MSSLRSRWLWRGNLKKFPSVPLISLQALRRSCRSKVQSARVREHWLEVMEVCLSLPWEIPTKWKASLRFSSCILYCSCLENMHHSSSTRKTSPWRSPSHLWTVFEFKNWSCNVYYYISLDNKMQALHSDARRLKVMLCPGLCNHQILSIKENGKLENIFWDNSVYGVCNGANLVVQDALCHPCPLICQPSLYERLYFSDTKSPEESFCSLSQILAGCQICHRDLIFHLSCFSCFLAPHSCISLLSSADQDAYSNSALREIITRDTKVEENAVCLLCAAQV